MFNPLMPSGGDVVFTVFFVLVATFVVGGIVFSVVTASRKRRVLREAGLDPLTADAQVLAQVHQSKALAPERSAEARLAEAIALQQRGLITADELGEIRQRIIGEL